MTCDAVRPVEVPEATVPAPPTPGRVPVLPVAPGPTPSDAPGPMTDAPERRSNGNVVVLVIGLAVVAVLAVVVGVVIAGGSEDQVAPVATLPLTLEPDAEDQDPSGGGVGEVDDDASSSTTQTAVPATAAPPPTSASLAPGSWVAIVRSVPKAEAGAEQNAASLRDSLAGRGPTVVVLDSDAYGGLNDGYWAVAAGPFSTIEAARSSCGTLGLSLGGACYPRQL